MKFDDQNQENKRWDNADQLASMLQDEQKGSRSWDDRLASRLMEKTRFGVDQLMMYSEPAYSHRLPMGEFQKNIFKGRYIFKEPQCLCLLNKCTSVSGRSVKKTSARAELFMFMTIEKSTESLVHIYRTIWCQKTYQCKLQKLASKTYFLIFTSSEFRRYFILT